MLILTRMSGESIVIGDSVRIKILSIKGNRAKVAIEAPDQVRILREEVIVASSNNDNQEKE